MTPATLYMHRKALGLKRAQLARALGLAEQTFRNYETGVTRIPRYVALAIAALLGGLEEAE